MARKPFEDEPDNHERWLVSYADFITLLFAFFVVMYAISSVNEGKYKVFSNSLITAFNSDKQVLDPPPIIAPVDRRQAAIRRERERLTKMARELKRALAPLVQEGKVRVIQSAKGVSVEINASVLFAPGEARLSNESDQALKTVAVLLQTDKHEIQVEGHTDNVPINNPQFASNWELSAARASSVVRLFIDSGIDEKRLTALGHAANISVSSNDSPEGRARNRRVAVTVLSDLPDRITEISTEPAPANPASNTTPPPAPAAVSTPAP